MGYDDIMHMDLDHSGVVVLIKVHSIVIWKTGSSSSCLSFVTSLPSWLEGLIRSAHGIVAVDDIVF